MTATSSQKLSIILSFRNEEVVIPEMVRRLQSVCATLQLDHEIIFVNDCSTDGSLDVLKRLAREDPRTKIVNTARRCGVSECVLGGLAYATGDAAVYMDADLQDPPEVIPELVARWRAGAEVVYTVRVSRAGESPFKLWATRLAYKIISALSDTPLPVEAGDFRLLSRRAVRQLLQFRERRPYLRGLVTWMGFRQAAVSYTRERRFAGDGHFPLLASKGPMLMFLAGVLSFSYIPLSFFAVLGSLVTLGALAALVVALVGGLLGSDVGGAFVLLAVGALLSGVQLLGIGVLGLYLSRVLDEVRNRPQFIVESVIGFD